MLFKDLRVGERAKVIGFTQTDSPYRRKLLALGLTPGIDIEITRVAPMGDPVEIRVRGFALSLRKDEANALRLEPIA